ncbi:hypothetical protein [Fulvivirga lutea]|uniref:Uncharacterized protein n=1 Tax=Fulvivirga lutea TaxID=2810512 RepID=A0A974WEH3_9BACT|nr:hypothetical protein [Fulvivirga lutea]QSE95888.1 hypothetical protein JR347_09670 [Fulvivirga lutea]
MKQNLLFKLFVLFGCASAFSGCESCDECSNDLSARFRFVDSNREEILDDPTLLTIIDLNNNSYTIDREVVEEDTFYVANLSPMNMEFESPDTVLFTYDNMLIDSVAIDYTFSSDSRCCQNTLKVNRLNFFNRDEARRIKPGFSIFDVIID